MRKKRRKGRKRNKEEKNVWKKKDIRDFRYRFNKQLYTYTQYFYIKIHVRYAKLLFQWSYNVSYKMLIKYSTKTEIKPAFK